MEGRYTILSDINFTLLEKKANKAIDEGWKPLGAPFRYGNEKKQAMTRGVF